MTPGEIIALAALLVTVVTTVGAGVWASQRAADAKLNAAMRVRDQAREADRRDLHERMDATRDAMIGAIDRLRDETTRLRHDSSNQLQVRLGELDERMDGVRAELGAFVRRDELARLEGTIVALTARIDRLIEMGAAARADA